MSKVIIIGAGIGGLTAAIALQQQGFSVKIYEKTSKLSNIGGGFIIYAHGIRILQRLGLQNVVDSFYVDLLNFVSINNQSEILLNDTLDKFYAHCGNFLLPINRTDLQQMLVEALPPGILHMQHNCVKIIEHTDKIKVHFENGLEDEADFLIGADGIHSTVRKAVSQHVDINYCGICIWGGILENNYCTSIPKNSLVHVLGENRVSWIAPLSQHRQMWYIASRIPEENLVRSIDKISQLSTFCHNWNEWIDQILVAPQNEYNFAVPAHEITTIDRWVKGRIALIGDAAHAFGPIIGQGTSLAMEDAYILASCVAHSMNDIPQALLRYQSIRMPIVKQLHAIENKQQMFRITNDLELIKQRNEAISSSPIEKLLEPIANLINPTVFQEQIKASELVVL